MNKILAHRGFSAAYPENTMLAFQKALEIGADGVEFDVQLTSDGVPVILHDEDLNRVAGENVYVKDLTYAELRRLDVSYKFRGQVPKQTVPTLEEYFSLVKTRNFITNIELKTAYWEYPGIEQRVVGLIDAFHLRGRVILSSFNHYSLLRAKAIAPDIPCGLLYECRIAEPQDYAKRLGMDYLHPLYLFLNDEELAKYEKAGVKASPWTVDCEQDLRRLLGHKAVFSIITNVPDRALALRTVYAQP